jgi:hypothetical protein
MTPLVVVDDCIFWSPSLRFPLIPTLVTFVCFSPAHALQALYCASCCSYFGRSFANPQFTFQWRDLAVRQSTTTYVPTTPSLSFAHPPPTRTPPNLIIDKGKETAEKKKERG